MTVASLVQQVKRLCQIGDINTTTDQVTTDIVSFLNNRMYEVWRKWPWDWLLFPVSIQTVIGQTDYTLSASVGGIVVLSAGVNGYLKTLSLKRYTQWFLNNQVDPVTGIATVPANGNVTHYVKIGRDSSGNIKIRLWRPPDTAVVITGFGKQRITTYAVSDIAAGTSIAYFPSEVQDILLIGVCANIYESMNLKDQALASENNFQSKIQMLKAEAEDGQDDDPTCPPPDYFIWKKRKRGGTTVV